MELVQISDIHFGALPNDKNLYEQLCIFTEYCENNKPDFIIIAGDCYDKRVSIESDSNIYFNKFIDDLINKTNSVIFIIEGTYSHDRKQINALMHYCSDRFYIFNKVSEISLKGLDFLIIPEEYVKSIDYYKKYLNKKYDFVFGHGMFKHVSFGQNENGEITYKNFIFDHSMFENNIKYCVGFGHIHQHSIYKNIVYSGSFSRLCFGEEDKKGFISYIIDKNNKLKINFIENEKAPSFTSIYAHELPDNTEQLLIQLRNYSEFNDYLRIIIDYDIPDNKYNTISGFVKNRNNVIILRKNTHMNKKTKEIEKEMKEKQEELMKKMVKFKGLSFIEIIQKIAKDDYDTDFDQDYIYKILNSEK